MGTSRAKDLTGQKFGRWTVLGGAEDRHDSRGYARRYWVCQCSCEDKTIKEIREDRLKSGDAFSCGCYARERIREENFIDLTGMKFDRLTVVRQAEDYIDPSGKHYTRWYCVCECGGDCITKGTSLRDGSTKSCGCLHRERAAEAGKLNKKYNTYHMLDEYVVGITSNDNTEFYLDIDDYDKVKNFCWLRDAHGYIRTSIDGNNTRIHRIIMGLENADKKTIVDHINHNKADNRKCNLRITTYQKNLMNKDMSDRNNSGTTGVCWDKSRNKWRAYLSIDSKQIFSGRYNTKHEAEFARKEAEEKYFKEFSYANSMKIAEANKVIY